MIFITPEGNRVPVTGSVGQNLLDLAHKNNIELEGCGSQICVRRKEEDGDRGEAESERGREVKGVEKVKVCLWCCACDKRVAATCSGGV